MSVQTGYQTRIVRMRKILFFIFILTLGMQYAAAQNAQKKKQPGLSQHERKMQYASPSDISSGSYSGQDMQTAKRKNKSAVQPFKESKRIRRAERRLKGNKAVSFQMEWPLIRQYENI